MQLQQVVNLLVLLITALYVKLVSTNTVSHVMSDTLLMLEEPSVRNVQLLTVLYAYLPLVLPAKVDTNYHLTVSHVQELTVYKDIFLMVTVVYVL